MGDFILSSSSTADLPKEHFEKRDIHYICYHYFLNDEEYVDDLGQSMPLVKFYEAMRQGASTKTTQINVDEFVKYFTPFLEQGLDILHVELSSGLSGVISSANIAKNTLLEKFPDRKLYIVDSLAASGGLGLLMETLADLRDEGKDLDELYSWIEEYKLNMHHWFFVSDLTYLVRGGRVSKVSGWVGNMLNIHPLLNIDMEGRLIPRFKVRGKKKVINQTLNQMMEHAENGLDYSKKCFISHADALEDAQKLAQLIEEKFPKLNGKVQLSNIGTTIGSHTGPGTVNLFFWGNKRTD